MSLQYHVSDLHIGHGAICKYRPFYHASHHHWYMMCALFLTADFRNVLLNHGDSVFVDRYDDVLRNIYSMYEKVVEMGGNHCYEKIPMKRKFFMDLDNVELQAFYKKYNAWMSHAPVHTSELRARMNFHGHVHDDSIPDPMYINCCMESEFMEYWPKNHQELLAIAAKRASMGIVGNPAAGELPRVDKFTIHLDRIKAHAPARSLYEWTRFMSSDPERKAIMRKAMLCRRDDLKKTQRWMLNEIATYTLNGRELIFKHFPDSKELATLLLEKPE